MTNLLKQFNYNKISKFFMAIITSFTKSGLDDWGEI